MNTKLTRLASGLVLSVAMLAVGLAATPTPAPAPTASLAPTNAPVLARAKKWLLAIQSGSIDRTQLSDAMNAALTDASVKTLAGEVGPFGPPNSFVQTRIVHSGANTGYVYNIIFQNGTRALMVFALDDATSKVTGLRLTPTP